MFHRQSVHAFLEESALRGFGIHRNQLVVDIMHWQAVVHLPLDMVPTKMRPPVDGSFWYAAGQLHASHQHFAQSWSTILAEPTTALLTPGGVAEEAFLHLFDACSEHWISTHLTNLLSSPLQHIRFEAISRHRIRCLEPGSCLGACFWEYLQTCAPDVLPLPPTSFGLPYEKMGVVVSDQNIYGGMQ